MTDSVGEQLRRYRTQAGWTQHQLAQALGIAPITVQSLEQGRRRAGAQVRRAARRAGIPLDGDGDGTGALTPAEYESVLAASWALFYGGQPGAAVASVQACIRGLGELRGDAALATLGRFHQLAGVIARDEGRLGDAIAHGTTALQIARQQGEADNLASGLFRLARSHQKAGDDRLAVQLVREAADLTPRLRWPLAGVVFLAQVETEAGAAAPNTMNRRDAQAILTRVTHGLLARPGMQDSSFTHLNGPGIDHISAVAALYAGLPDEALEVITLARVNLPPQMHRWRAGFDATEVWALAQQRRAAEAADLAEDVLRVSPNSTSHRKYLRLALGTLARYDTQGRDPHVTRLRRLLAA